MENNTGRKTNDWVVHQLRGLPQPSPGILKDRRDRTERRVRLWWGIAYGSFKPRRRQPARRDGEERLQLLDWHASHLMAVAVGILLLCFADAFMTLILLSNGAQEINPVMARLVHGSVTMFTGLKMAVTGASVVFMVLLAHYRFMRLVRVETALYVVLAGYAGLIGYELWLVSKIVNPS